MKKTMFYLAFFLMIISSQSFGQGTGMTFQEAEKKGISIDHLESIYKSAVHSDTSLAVFKTPEQQDALYEAYVKLLQDFGNFLAKNNFKWEKPTKCFNRIYFSPNGKIDYFLFNFMGKANELPADKQATFNKLLNQFVKYYQFAATAKVKFAQCSPTTYMPQK